MNCGFMEKISSLIDGELSPAEARDVERHLVMCVQCAEARADFLSLRSQIASFESSVPPVVQNRALAKILSPRSRERTAASFGVAWKWTAIGFASILIVAVSIFLISSKQPQQVAVNGSGNKPAAVSSPTPAPASEPSKPERNDKQKNSGAPARQQTPRKSPIVREPKPGEQFAAIPERVRPADAAPVRPADAQTLTAIHFERAETLLRAFRNVRLDQPESATEVSYERNRARQLIYQNMMLRREADASGDVQRSEERR